MKTSEIPLWTETPVEGEVITHVEISPGTKRLRRVPIENISGPKGPQGEPGAQGIQGPVGNGALTLAEMDDRYVNESGDTMEGALAIVRPTTLTVGGRAFNIQETWDNAGEEFFGVYVDVTQLNAHSNSAFFIGARGGEETIALKTNGTIRGVRRLDDNFETMLQLWKRGTVGDSTAALASGSGVGAVDFYGWNGTAFALGARVLSVTNEVFTGIASGTHLRLYATPTGTTTALERLRVDGSLVTSFVNFQVGSGAQFQVSITGLVTFADGIRQIFNPNATNAGINVGGVAGNPSAPVNGDIWYNSTTNALKAQADGVSFNIRPLHSVLTYAATTDLDFDAGDYRSLTLAGNVTFTTSNRGAPKALAIRIIGDGSIRTLTFPVGWKFVGAAPPASLAANKIAILSVTCFGAADTDIVAAYSAEP